MLSQVGDYEGTKASIANSFLIKEHMMKAAELEPNDPLALHLLGRCMSPLLPSPYETYQLIMLYNRVLSCCKFILVRKNCCFCIVWYTSNVFL